MTAKTRLSWDTYDHLEVMAMEDPVSLLKELRDQTPVGHSKKHGGYYVVTRYEDCVVAARDARLSSDPRDGPGPGFPFSADVPLRQPMIMDEGARHSQFRMPLQRMFSPNYAKSLREKIHHICDKLIDEFIETGEADLADQFSIEVPAILIAELLDLPMDRRREFQKWAAEYVATFSPESQLHMTNAVAELYELRTAHPGDDIPSKLLAFEIDGRPISSEEWRGLVMLLILGGLDTTANAGGYIFNMIGQSEEIRAYLTADRANIAKAVPEFIRLISPVPQHSRGIIEDVEIGGVTMQKGDVVQLNWLAANHDPTVFLDPEKFDPDRRNSHHVGFGHGRHMCLGRHLAVVELEVMIERILARLPDYRLVPNGTKRFKSLNRGMSNMCVTFTPGQRSGGADRND